MSELVHLDVANRVATITLDSPHNRNAMSRRLLEEFDDALVRARDDSDVRGVLLTATGTTFCAGADLKDPPGNSDGSSVSVPRILSNMWSFPKAIVVQLNGHVRAGGIGIVGAADIVIAPRSATFAFTEVRIGVAPAIIAAVCRQQMSPRALLRYTLTGETFDAAAAMEAGLVTVAVPDEDTAATAEAVLQAIRLTEPNAVRATKQLLRELPAMGMDDAFSHAEALSLELFRSPAAAEGIQAFREKRPPSWV